MKANRICNFNAGPAALPLPVLEEIQESLLDYKGTGMSIMEMSHRSKEFEAILNDAIARTRRLLQLDERFHVIFLQGGASLQFSHDPDELPGGRPSADYVNTGTWSTKAIKEARVLDKTVDVVGLVRGPAIHLHPAGRRRSTRMPSTSTSPPTTRSAARSGPPSPRPEGCRSWPTCPPIS